MYCIMYDVLSQISNCKSQIYFYKVLKVPKDSRDSRDIFFYYLNEVLSREKHQLAVISVVIDWSNKSNGSDRTDGYF